MPSHARSSTPVVAVIAALFVGLVVGIGGVLAWGRLNAPDPAAAAGAPGGGGPPGGGDGGMMGMPPATVRVGTVMREEMQQRFDVVGRLEELRRATVAAEAEGKILAVPVEEGQRVEGGKTVLARIDPIWSRVALEAAEARVASAEAMVEQSEREFKYLEELQANGAARPKEVDDARAKAKAERAALEAAVAERSEAMHRFERVEVVAPFDGHVVRKLVEMGQWVEPGGEVAELVSAGKIDAVVDVPETMVNAIGVGDAVEVTVEPVGRRFTGEVVAVVPSAGTSARTFPVKVRLDDGGGLLKPGMSVLAHLPVGESSLQLTVPRDAVLFQGGKATVWAASAQAGGGASPEREAPPEGGAPPMPTASPTPVEVLFGVGDRFVVSAELEPGTQVVIEGAESLMPSQPLVVLPSEPPSAGAPLTRSE